MFHFTPLLGAQSDSQAHSSLLELDGGIKILVDVGWDERFDVGMLKEIERVAPQLSLILLTHSTIPHIGAYAHCCKYIPYFTSIPVYSTFPISALGRLLLTDLYLSNPCATPQLPPLPPPPNSSDGPTLDSSKSASASASTATHDPSWLLPPPTSSEIATYFSHIHLLKYSQPHHPLVRTPSTIHHGHHRTSGAGHTQQNPTLTITAYNAGHTLGGTIWKIAHSQESIVYAVSWNHTRENHLSGAAFLTHASNSSSTVATTTVTAASSAPSIIASPEGLGRPTALICSSRTTDSDHFGATKWTRKKRDEALIEVIRSVAVGKGKVVLIPTDSTARVLELAYLLEHAFRKDRHLSGNGGDAGAGAGLYLVGRKAKRLANVVGSMLEWMDESVVKELEGTNQAQQQDQNQRGNRRGNNRQNQQGQTSTQKQAAGPFDFVHLKILDKPAQVEKLIAPYTSFPPPEAYGSDQGDNVHDQDGDITLPDSADDSDADSATSLDYNPETGELVEKPSSRIRNKNTHSKPIQAQGNNRNNPATAKQPPKTPSRGIVILASDTSLEYGFSREIFTKIAGGEGNVVVLTELMENGGDEKKGGAAKSSQSLGADLANAWREGMRQKREKAASGGYVDKATSGVGVELSWDRKEVKIASRTPLQTPEVDAYKKHLSSLRKAASSSAHTTSTTSAIATTTGVASGISPESPSPLLINPSDVDQDTSDSSSDSSSDSDSDSDHPDKQGKSLATTSSRSKKALAAAALRAASTGGTIPGPGSSTGGTAGASSAGPDGSTEQRTILPAATVADLGISVLLRGKGVYDFDVRNAKGRNRMFPFAVKRRRGDEYGEVIKAEEYLRAEEREEAAAHLLGLEDKVAAIAAAGREKDRERVMGRKRKWEEAGAAMMASSGTAGGLAGKGRKNGKKGMFGSAGKDVAGGNRGSTGTLTRKSGKRRKQSGDDHLSSSNTADDEDEEGEVKESDNDSNGLDDDDSDSGEENSEAEAQIAQPSRLSTMTLVLKNVKCRVHYIDFAGLHDSRSLRMLLPLINPRKLILVSGTAAQIGKLAGDCRELLAPKGAAALLAKYGGGGAGARVTDVFTPVEGECINASVDTNAWTVKLSERLVRSLKWQEVGGLGVVHVVGKVVASESAIAAATAGGAAGTGGGNGVESGDAKKRKMVEGSDVGDGKKVDGEGDSSMASTTTVAKFSPPPLEESKKPSRMLDLIQPATGPSSSASAIIPTTSSSATFHLRNLTTRPIHVGDIKLTDLRRVLTAAGHTAEFGGEGGALVCDGVVVVRKIGVGRVVVEDGGGGLFVGTGKNKSFVEVRRKVYNGLAVVRAGAGGGGA